MDQNQLNDNDLQKAIDDITNGMGGGASAPTAATDVASQIANNLTNAPAASAPVASAPASEPAPAPATQPMMSAVDPMKAAYGDQDVTQIKESALRELFPLMDKVALNPVQKFRIYKDIIELTHDKSVIEPAYASARKIADERARAEALLFLIELIDNLGL